MTSRRRYCGFGLASSRRRYCGSGLANVHRCLYGFGLANLCRCLLVLGASLPLVAPSGAAGQDGGLLKASASGVTELAEQCAPAFRDSCRELSLAAMAIQRGTGLASALGSDVPGTPSTLGRRLGRVPRTSFSLSALGVRMSMPRVTGQSPADLGQEHGFTPWGLRAGAVAGLLDGFRLMPNMGGVLSLDLTASYSLVRLPKNAGFDGSSHGFGAGARVGLVRESFVLPGISLSATRRWHSSIRTGSTEDGDPAQVETGLTVSSLRATAGKNWFVIGVMAGAGWDRYEGDAHLALSTTGAGAASAEGRMRSDRLLYFAAAWFNFVISQVSVEAGVAEGVEDPFSDDRSGGFDPAKRTWFASAAFRVTL